MGYFCPCHVPCRTMWTHMSFCRELIILPCACVWSLDTYMYMYFNLLPSYHLCVLFVGMSYIATFCLQIYSAILKIYNANFMGFLSFTSFCRKQAYNSLCQFSCRAPTFTSFCCAHNNFLVLWSCFQMTIPLNYCAHYSCVLKQLDR